MLESVLAYHEGLRTTGVYTVTDTFSHLDPVIVELTLSGETIETTPEHPFYVLLRGWVDAGDLRPGMAVRQADGDYELVETVELEQRTQRMYNLTVAEAHTFFVGDEAWLVHNACGATLTIEFRPGMNRRDFDRKVRALQDLAERGKLRVLPDTDSIRDRAITAGFKDRLIKRAWSTYADNPDLRNRIVSRIRGLQPDHIHELQLGGSDTVDNLWLLDGVTNTGIGAQIHGQIVKLQLSPGTLITHIIAR